MYLIRNDLDDIRGPISFPVTRHNNAMKVSKYNRTLLPAGTSADGLSTKQSLFGNLSQAHNGQIESIAAGISTPEEQIARNREVLRSRWRKTPDIQFYMQKKVIRNGNEVVAFQGR